jgi:hypothetical protein
MKLNNHIYYPTEYDDLSVRSLNVIDKYFKGDISELIKYYKNKYSFLELKNIGATSNKELINYCITEINKNKLEVSKMLDCNNIQAIKSAKSEQDILDLRVIALENIYANFKQKASARLLNILINLENRILIPEYKNDITGYLFSYLFKEMNQFKIRNMGTKTRNELLTLKQAIEKSNEFIEHFIGEDQTARIKSKIDKQNIAVVVDEIYCKIWESDHFKEIEKSILKKRIQDTGKETLRLIAEKYSKTGERVRQIEKILLDSKLPKFINHLIDLNYEYVLPDNSFNLFFCVQNNGLLDSSGAHELKLKRIILNQILSRFHRVLNLKAICIKKLSYAPYKNKKYHLLLNADYIYCDLAIADKYKINELITWTIQNIIDFSYNEFSFNLEVLITRFYNENSLHFDRAVLHLIIDVLIETNIESLFFIGHKKNDDVFKRETAEIIKDIISQRNKPLSIMEIHTELSQKQIVLNIKYISDIIHKNHADFVYVGVGMWAIKEIVPPEFTGSLRKIVYSIIRKRNVPVHFQEVINLISRYRIVTEHSLITNLRSLNDTPFQFFNCGLIGVKERKYDKYWHDLKPINPAILNKFRLEINKNPEQINNIVNEYSEKYKYGREHLYYLAGKYDLYIPDLIN